MDKLWSNLLSRLERRNIFLVSPDLFLTSTSEELPFKYSFGFNFIHYALDISTLWDYIFHSAKEDTRECAADRKVSLPLEKSRSEW